MFDKFLTTHNLPEETADTVWLPRGRSAVAPAGARQRVRDMEALQAAFDETEADGIPEAPAVPSAARRKLRDAVKDSGRAFMAADALPQNTNAFAWWASSGKEAFPRLYPGARSVLQHVTGNAGEERMFAQSGIILSDKKQLESDAKMKAFVKFISINDWI